MNDAITALVRRHDPDRFLTALFAPAERRDALLVLYAFNHELARAREVADLADLAEAEWMDRMREARSCAFVRRRLGPPPQAWSSSMDEFHAQLLQ